MAPRGAAAMLCLAFFIGVVSAAPFLVTLRAAHDNTTLQIEVKNIAASTIRVFGESLALNDLALDHKVSAICDGTFRSIYSC